MSDVATKEPLIPSDAMIVNSQLFAATAILRSHMLKGILPESYAEIVGEALYLHNMATIAYYLITYVERMPKPTDEAQAKAAAEFARNSISELYKACLQSRDRLQKLYGPVVDAMSTEIRH